MSSIRRLLWGGLTVSTVAAFLLTGSALQQAGAQQRPPAAPLAAGPQITGVPVICWAKLSPSMSATAAANAACIRSRLPPIFTLFPSL